MKDEVGSDTEAFSPPTSRPGPSPKSGITAGIMLGRAIEKATEMLPRSSSRAHASRLHRKNCSGHFLGTKMRAASLPHILIKADIRNW